MIITLGVISCTKETEQVLTEQAQPSYSVTQQGIKQGILYECKSKDVGGYYTSHITFNDKSNFTMHFDRGTGYFTNNEGTYTLVDNHLVMNYKGGLLMLDAIVTFDPGNPEGFVLTRHNGKVETYYRK